jgi:hypothetical protein
VQQARLCFAALTEEWEDCSQAVVSDVAVCCLPYCCRELISLHWMYCFYFLTEVGSFTTSVTNAISHDLQIRTIDREVRTVRIEVFEVNDVLHDLTPGLLRENINTVRKTT